MARSRDFIGIAEGIQSHELSTKGQIENLKGRISELSARRSSLSSTISYLEAAIAAAYEDTDEDDYPDYGLIASLETQKSSAENELSGVEQDLDSTSGELENKQNELEIVEEEKAQTLFEIQERARKTSDNISLAGGMYGAYAGVGSALQNSLRTSLSSLSQAAGILGGSVDGAPGGSLGKSASGVGNASSGETGTNGEGGNSETGALAAFAGGYSDEALPLLASQFSTNQDQSATPASLPNYHSGQSSLNTKALQSFSTEQSANEYALSSFGEVTAPQTISQNVDEYRSGQHSFADWINPDSYTKDGHYIGAGQSWGYKPYGDDSSEYESTVMTPAQRVLDSYMQSYNYGKENFETYSKDAEWQKLHKAAYPDSGVVSALVGSELAKQHLREYMDEHNYSKADYFTYSKDPEWRRLHYMAYPGNINKFMNKSGRGAEEPTSVTWGSKLGERAQGFFSSFFSSLSEQAGDNFEEGDDVSRPTNQILSGIASTTEYQESNGNSIHQQFADLRKIEVNKLSKENLSSIVNIAVQNLKSRYGNRVVSERFDGILEKISFINDKQVRRELGRSYSANICGYYSPESDTIRINLDGNATVEDILATIDHEAMHLLSKHMESQGGVLNSNILDNNVGMNEGITEMLSIKNMQSINPGYVSNVYIDEVEIMQRFESICGEKELLDAYLKSDMSGIEAEFNRLLGSRKAFEKLCNDIDILHRYNNVDSSDEWASVYRAEARKRILQRLDRYQAAKLGVTTAAASPLKQELLELQSDDSKSSTDIQLRFGRKKRTQAEKEKSSVSMPTHCERIRSFADTLYGGLTYEQQAEDARRRRNAAVSGTSSNDDTDKEERQRSRPDDREI